MENLTTSAEGILELLTFATLAIAFGFALFGYLVAFHMSTKTGIVGALIYCVLALQGVAVVCAVFLVPDALLEKHTEPDQLEALKILFGGLQICLLVLAIVGFHYAGGIPTFRELRKRTGKETEG